MVPRWNVPDLKARCAVNAEQVTVRIKTQVLLIEQADDRDDASCLSGIKPALHIAHADGNIRSARVSWAFGAIEQVGNNRFHEMTRPSLDYPSKGEKGFACHKAKTCLAQGPAGDGIKA